VPLSPRQYIADTYRSVTQELALSPSATLVCGEMSVDWRKFAEVLWSLQKAGLVTPVPDEYFTWPFGYGL